MTLSEIDRQLLEKCLSNEPRSWEAFIDRFLGLVIHVINHTTESRGVKISQAERDDLVSEVFLALLNNDCAVLRRFRRQSSLATYLTVIARRVIVHKISVSRQVPMPGGGSGSTNRLPQQNQSAQTSMQDQGNPAGQQLENREHIEHLMQRLDPKEADVVRMHHLEGKSYEEISSQLGMPQNSIGPTLTRAREKMRAAESQMS